MNFLNELLNLEIIEIDETTNFDELLSEAAKKVFKRRDQKIIRYYRCTSGPKKGKLVSDPMMCGLRKDPKKVRHGRKVARTKKGVRVRKSQIAKKTALSKTVSKLNQML